MTFRRVKLVASVTLFWQFDRAVECESCYCPFDLLFLIQRHARRKQGAISVFNRLRWLNPENRFKPTRSSGR